MGRRGSRWKNRGRARQGHWSADPGGQWKGAQGCRREASGRARGHRSTQGLSSGTGQRGRARLKDPLAQAQRQRRLRVETEWVQDVWGSTLPACRRIPHRGRQELSGVGWRHRLYSGEGSKEPDSPVTSSCPEPSTLSPAGPSQLTRHGELPSRRPPWSRSSVAPQQQGVAPGRGP